MEYILLLISADLIFCSGIADAKSFSETSFSFTENLVDKVWGSDRPARPKSHVFPLEIKYSGMTT